MPIVMMEKLSDRLKYYINAHTDYSSIRKFEEAIKWKHNTVNQMTDNPKVEKLEDLHRFLPQLNIEWLLTGKGVIKIISNQDLLSHLPEPKPRMNSTVKEVMSQLDKIKKKKEKILIPLDENARQLKEDEDYIWIETYIIPEKAGLSLSTHYFAESYVNGLEKGMVRVRKKDSGKYYEVEASGDSMNDGSNRILDRDWFLARDVPRDEWKFKLSLRNQNAFYFLHDTRGHIIKEVVSHDTETGILKLTCWNPDKQEYPDFEINIKDCYIVAKIIKLISRDFNAFY